MKRIQWISSTLLILPLVAAGGLLAAWKKQDLDKSAAAMQNQPEATEVIRAALATPREYRHSSTSIGTVIALRSVTLRNELAGTVDRVLLKPGAIVEPGELLVALDVSVEEAELTALQAEAILAEANLKRAQRLVANNAAAAADLERAIAERDVALSRIARTKAVIERKTIRAPFRARVGLADVHPGQFLEAGTVLTTLQGVDTLADVNFDVTQAVASRLRPGDRVDLIAQSDQDPIPAEVLAVNARIDPSTRNATVRARFALAEVDLRPGASVRVAVPTGPAREVVAIPADALRRGPDGDRVFVIKPDQEGAARAHVRMVEAGPANGQEILILSGLEPGERVAAAGSFKLHEESLVSIANETALAASSR